MSKKAPEKVSEVNLKLVFADVLKGYTMMKAPFFGEKDIYIKHLNIFDDVKTDSMYNTFLEKAKSKKLPTEEDQKKYLDKEDIWKEKDDQEIVKLELYADNLRSTKSKLFLKTQIDNLRKQIEENDVKVFELKQEREKYMGFTAERYAAKRSNELYIRLAVYKDKSFETLAINEEEFDELSDVQLSEIVGCYNKATEYVTIKNLKKISLLPFFCNYFYLCDDNPQVFYGKPVIDLTFFQAEMFAFGRYFKALVQDAKASPPDDIRNDPDKLVDFYEARKNADEVLDKIEERSKHEGGASSLVGATKEDLEALGYTTGGPNTIDLAKVAAKKGGTLSMEDFIEIHE
ncbi:hypothetical protein CL634_11460 [bacterium]|nr:hypothetical protein [bacterium]|tara:strand:- start:345 stop:1379 length:1035 start_codon:yes stop_codon:yes gene_type:complete